MEDSKIISLYFARSEQAITETSLKYGSYCGTIARNILRNNEDTEECVSDTWMRTWNAIPPEKPSIFRAFLGKITRNLALTRWEAAHAVKRGGGETAVALDELEECIEDAGAGTWSADHAVLKDVLNEFLSQLPKDKRVVFVRRYWYMDSIRDIASELGLSESNVKMTLMRARKELAQRLIREGIEV